MLIVRQLYEPGRYSHAMRNEHDEEVVADLVGENDAKPDAALMSGGRINRRGSESGKK